MPGTNESGTVRSIVAQPEKSAAATLRIDRWLFTVRLFKSRAAAANAVSGGKVHLNGERVRPSRTIKRQDMVTFARSTVLFDCVVAAVPLRRGPASEASECYEETAASKARREEFSVRMRAADAITPKSDGRPDKHGRRLLRQLRGRN